MDRRAVLAGLGGVALLGAGGYGLWLRDAGRYVDEATALRLPMNLAATGADRLAELVRFASLAPNSHNTQAWLFTPIPNGIAIEVDPSRRTPVVDPDDHHLFVSLGCATETLVVAATAFGLTATPEVAPDGVVKVTFVAGAAPSPLWPAIARRQSHRGLYDGTPLTAADRAALQGADPDLRLIEVPATLTALRDLTVAAYGAQMDDKAYRAELKAWLRFSEADAMRRRDGLFSGCSGNPSLPQGLGDALFPVIVTARSQQTALQAQLDSSPALALLVTPNDTPQGRIKTGRRLQRICLAATQANLALSHVNPALENPEGREQVARLCGVTSGRPSILLRLGHAVAPFAFSLRRPAASILST